MARRPETHGRLARRAATPRCRARRRPLLAAALDARAASRARRQRTADREGRPAPPMARARPRSRATRSSRLLGARLGDQRRQLVQPTLFAARRDRPRQRGARSKACGARGSTARAWARIFGRSAAARLRRRDLRRHRRRRRVRDRRRQRRDPLGVQGEPRPEHRRRLLRLDEPRRRARRRQGVRRPARRQARRARSEAPARSRGRSKPSAGRRASRSRPPPSTTTAS